jgi:uncharacterized Zn-binding protein involved in type VI secretion
MPGMLKSTVDVTGGKNVVGSPNVIVNDKPAVRIGDSILPHGRASHSKAVMATGSSTVFVNSIPACRGGDIADCGHVSSSGSGNVIAG